MQLVKRILGGFFLGFILLWIFAPKVELYYLLEKSLKEKNIIISNETITDTWYGLKVQNADFYVAGAKIATSAELNFNFFLLYNTLKIKEIKTYTNLAPKEINQFNAIYSIANPFNIKLDGEGSFGILDGKVALKDRRVEILFPETKDIEALKKFLKNDKEKGWFYETNY